MEIKDILLRLQELYIDAHRVRNLLNDGKVIKADNKMQGLMTKLGFTIRELGGENTIDANVVNESSKESDGS